MKESYKRAFSLPVAIVLASAILGGSLIVIQVNKQRSIERQQQIELEAKESDTVAPKKSATLTIEQCKIYATNQAQKAIEEWIETVPPQNCGGNLECINNSMKLILAQTDFLKRTTYDKEYQSCLNK